MGSRNLLARLVIASTACVILAACSGETQTPTRSPTSAASPTATPDPFTGGAVATFDVVGEQFKVWVTNDGTIEEMLAVLAGNSNATIPTGPILRGPGEADHNAPHDWHLDPEQTEMAELTIEICDGLPSYVDEHVDEFVNDIGRYCPWSADIVNVTDHREGQ